MKKKGKIISRVVSFIFVLLSLIALFLSNYIMNAFPNVTVEQLLYSIQSAEGTSDNMIINGFLYVFPRVFSVLLLMFILLIILKNIFKIPQSLIIVIKNRKFKFSLVPLSNGVTCFLATMFLIFSIYHSLDKIGLIEYLDVNRVSNYIEENYVNPKKVEINSPENKRNLIYIYVESLETTLFSRDNGGNFIETVIPNLEKIALENTSFSNKESLGGAYMMEGTNWTIAGMVASTAGVPLKLSNEKTNDSSYGSFLSGAYSLGDILKENGYRNYLMLGSNADFGSRRSYFSSHGDYTIYDYNTAKEKEWIPKDYEEWWGYEDRKLYEFAKNELSEIASKNEPFNFTMLTADTHATDGYVDSECKKPYKEKYLNSYNCTDSMIAEFIDWILQQDFYKNTTIVIVGDHLSMQGNLMEMYTVPDGTGYERKIYNAFINTETEFDNNKNRAFTTFDLYPTVLASLGFEIEGERLGLGTNLFSSTKTLLEEKNFEEVNEELSKKSKFYNNKLLKLDK